MSFARVTKLRFVNFSLIFLSLLTVLPGPVHAQEPSALAAGRLPGKAARQIAALLKAKAKRSPAQRKVSSQLLQAQRPPAERPPASAPHETRLKVDVRAEVTPELVTHIHALGGTVINSVPRYRAIRAQLPPAALEPLAELEMVRWIRTADEAATPGPLPNAASGVAVDAPHTVFDAVKVDSSEGDRAHQADVARRRYGVDGSGIGIGVLSNGVGFLADGQASGDLPDRVTVLPGQEGFGAEGTAMLEIIHDLAPGARLYFATAVNGEAQFAANMEALCEAGADVIVDDAFYFREAAFQDGIAAQGINAAVDAGCFYVTPAGNSGNLNDGTSGVWEGDFAAGRSMEVDGKGFGRRHDFGRGITANRVKVDSPHRFVLQWADPLGASANDYDLFLVGADGDLIASSTDTQEGAQDPIEVIDSFGFDHTGARLVVVKVSGRDRYLRLSAIEGQLEIATDGNTFGHYAASNTLTTAAVDARTAGDDGIFNGTETVETFSSDGPRRIFFEPDGSPVTPGNFSATGGEVLQKPDAAAADGVSTSTPDFSTFSGTSAAAPHAAAMVALLLEAAGGPANLRLEDLRAAIAAAALDIEDPGVDRDSGAGIMMAPDTVGAVAVAQEDRNRPPQTIGALTDLTLLVDTPAVTIDLEEFFADPDDDSLTYAVRSSDAARVAVTQSEFQVTLSPQAPGRVQVTVAASDPGGFRVIQVFTVAVAAGDRDYDLDDDKLIEVADLAQLDAIRYDLEGDGVVDGPIWRPYYDAYPEGALEMGCPEGCAGYELTADLDFDTNANGRSDAGDSYWNDGAGWLPVGVLTHYESVFPRGDPYRAVFEGNGHTLSNLFIDRPSEIGVGLFGFLSQHYGEIRNLGLLGVRVEGQDFVGSFAGVGGSVTGSHATGQVWGREAVGGLVGNIRPVDRITSSYAAVRVTGTGNGIGGLVGVEDVFASVRTSYATGKVSGLDAVGGLVGLSVGEILASYATGSVTGRGFHTSPTRCEIEGGVGGLVGAGCNGPIRASYATGLVSGDSAVGGLVGTATAGFRFRSNYWDLETSGRLVGVGSDDANDSGVIDAAESKSPGVAGHTTAALQEPTGYEGIYATWRLDLAGGRLPDELWDFGTSVQYPVLLADLDGDGGKTWQEFGFQLREGPMLTVTTPEGRARVDLTWTGVDPTPWTSAPPVTYSLLRDNRLVVDTIASRLDRLEYADTAVRTGALYTYQVVARVRGGDAARSARVTVRVGASNQGPVAVGTLPGRTLRRGSGSELVEVAGAFRDPDGDELEYGVVSSSATIARVRVSGAQVTITPGSPGRTLITVTATDRSGSNRSAKQSFMVTVWPAHLVDYDTDDDGLIEISNLTQLDAVRNDLDGDGMVEPGGGFFRVPGGNPAAYAAAFPEAVEGMGCGALDGCFGYELLANLDFDTDGSGAPGADDAYWNDGAGWEPIGGAGSGGIININPFRATFEGNGHTIANLFIKTDAGKNAGLFAYARSESGEYSVIRHLALIDAEVTGNRAVGGLVGRNGGMIAACHVTGRVAGVRLVGGLTGYNNGAVIGSAVTADVEAGNSVGGVAGNNYGVILHTYATGRVRGTYWVGGLAGGNWSATIAASFATGPVEGYSRVGGLTGENGHTITASYATGSVSGSSRTGGLVGYNTDVAFHHGVIDGSYATGPLSGAEGSGGLVGFDEATVRASYWDTNTSGRTSGGAGQGKTTAELQAPTGYTGIYRTWNLDPDGDGTPDDPWDFGTSSEYPVLSADLDRDGRATWQEFGFQSRDGSAPSPTTVRAMSITSNPGPDATYGLGDAIEVTVEFTRIVVVTGTPSLRLRVGTRDRTATFRGGTDRTLLFSYRVVEGDSDPDGIGIRANGVARGNGRIRDGAGFDAVLDHEVLRDDADHRVDGIRPEFREAAVTGDQLRLIYDEALDESSEPPPDAFTVSGGASTHAVAETAVNWRTVTLTLDPPVAVGETGITVSYAVPSGNPIRDLAGNEAEALTDAPAAPAEEDETRETVLDFAHFANGSSITSDLVLVNVAPHAIRPAVTFYDPAGDSIDAATVVDLSEDLEIREDGALTVATAIPPLGERTISTHGRGELTTGSVRVFADGPAGGVLRFDLPGVGVAGVGASRPVASAVFPARRQSDGINTGAAIRNLTSQAMTVTCRLMREGENLAEAPIRLPAGGQVARFIDEPDLFGEWFAAGGSSGFSGSVHCTAPGDGTFAGVALELDAGNRIFTTLPVVPVEGSGQGQETTLNFAHFGNGYSITSDLVLVNVSTEAVAPAITFHDPEGNPIDPESVVDVSADLELTDDGAVTVATAIPPLGERTISTTGRGELRTGSVTVVAPGPIGGVLRFNVPAVGVAGVGASEPVEAAVFPARRQEDGINTGAAIRNLEAEVMTVTCRLMRNGRALEQVRIDLEPRGQRARFIDEPELFGEWFKETGASDFTGSVHCSAPEGGTFTGVALEMDPENRIFTTLPVIRE